MKRILNINLITTLFILLVCSSQAFAKTTKCEKLIKSIKKGKTERAIQQLKETDVNCAVTGDGTPLINAARSGNLAMVAILTKFYDADINKGSLGDGNPLIQASRHGNLEIAAYLLQKGADVNAFVQEDETPLINAAAKGHLDVVKLLLANGADINKAVWSKNLGNGEMRSPLSMAKRNKHKEIVKYLKQNGAVK